MIPESLFHDPETPEGGSIQLGDAPSTETVSEASGTTGSAETSADPTAETSVPDLEDEDEVGVDAPARRFGGIAKLLATKNAAEVLVEDFGYPKEPAMAMAGAVVEPASFRRMLASPQEIRVIGGTFLVVQTRVWAHAVIPDPTNFRLAEMFGSPFLGEPELAHTPIALPVIAEGAQSVLHIRVKSRQHVEAVTIAGCENIKKQNPQVMASVPVQGVMMPTYGAAVEIWHEQEGKPVYALMTPDGSSRVTACHKELGLHVGDVLYRNNAGKARALVDEARAVADTPLRSLTDEQLRKNRVATLPMTILLKFLPDPGSDQDFATATRSLVGLLHVAPPTPWTEPASREATAAGVLSVLAGHYTPAEIRFLNGTLPAQDAEKAGFFKYLDQRAGYINHLFSSTKANNRKLYDLIGRGIKTVRAGQEQNIKRAMAAKKTNQADRIQIGLELALTPVRDDKTLRTPMATVRPALERAYLAPVFKQVAWKISRDTPDAILAKAKKELEANLGAPGPKCAELGVLGAFWLCAAGVLVRASRSGDKDDWREPDSLLDSLIKSSHGLLILHAAVVAGRFAQDAKDLISLKIPTISPKGEQDIGGDQTPKSMLPDWLRAQMAGPGDAVDDCGEPDPRYRFIKAWGEFVKLAQDLTFKFNREVLGFSLESGIRVVDADGVNVFEAKTVQDELDGVVTELKMLTRIALRSAQSVQPDPDPSLDEDSD